MAGQLLPISVLYAFLNLPPMIMYAAFSAGLSLSLPYGYYSDSLFFVYWIVLFTPFATVISLPELKTKCRYLILFWRRNRFVNPQIILMTNTKVGKAILPPLTTVQ